jgi:hypothetical protein
MPTLRCDCGTEVQVPDEEAQELTWCPACRKTLIQPQSYHLPDRNYRSAAAPRGGSAPSGAGAGVAARVIGILVMAVVFGLGRASCHNSHYPSSNVSVPRFDPAPVPRFQPDEWRPIVPEPDRRRFFPEPDHRDDPALPPDDRP